MAAEFDVPRITSGYLEWPTGPCCQDKSGDYPLPETDAETRIRRIHAAPIEVVLAISGGGSGAIAELLAVPGASRTLLEAVVPYAPAAMVGLIGAKPERVCSGAAARAMAMAAFQRGRAYAPSSTDTLAGIGCTASLASDRPKRGDHRVHVAAQTTRATESWSLVLAKGKRTRAGEESVCADLVLAAIARAASIDDPVPVVRLPGETIAHVRRAAPQEWADLVLGRHDVVRAGPAAATPVLFPGAFQPLHDGHRAMARLAARMLGQPVAYELSILNVDKPPLDYVEMADRVRGLAGQTVWLTRAATFVAKSNLFPGATFLVGADTIQRLADCRYYQDDPTRMDAAIDTIRDRGCQFLVFGRLVDGTFRTLADLPLPARLREICRGVSADDFHDNSSSTEIRRRGKR